MLKMEEFVDLWFPAMRQTERWGLFDGRIGFVIFLFSLYRKTNIAKYKSYAEELLDSSEGVEYDSLGYRNGLTGIGVGFDYLIREQYVEADDDLLEGFDKSVRANFYDNLESLSYDELYGIGTYLYCRLDRPFASRRGLPFLQNEETMIDWISVVEERYASVVLQDPLAFGSLISRIHSLNLLSYKTRNLIGMFVDVDDDFSSDDVYERFGAPLFQLLNK